MKFFKFLIIAIMTTSVSYNASAAPLRVDVTSGSVKAMPIAIMPVETTNPNLKNLALNVTKIIERNLQSSGLFRLIPENSFIQRDLNVNDTPNFQDWKLTQAQAVLVSRILEDENRQVIVEFRLWDILSGNQIVGQRFATVTNNWRQLGHMVSDAVYSRMTGEKGYFNTRVVFISEEGQADKIVKRLAVMDQDGANIRYLSDGRALILTPRFSPNEQMITYMSYEHKRPAVFVLDLNTGQKRIIGTFNGLSFSPRFAPTGNSIIFSRASAGQTDIYTMNLNSGKTIRLTNSRSIDTAPSYSPDGKSVVFESDRGGTQQLYVMNNDGNNVKRITYGAGRYATPVWSPRGDLIAFTRMYKGDFYIGVIKPDGSGERLITKAYHAEGPTWAPNGRVLMYFKEERAQAGQKIKPVALYSIDITGMNETKVEMKSNASDPAWSPILQ